MLLDNLLFSYFLFSVSKRSKKPTPGHVVIGSFSFTLDLNEKKNLRIHKIYLIRYLLNLG